MQDNAFDRMKQQTDLFDALEERAHGGRFFGRCHLQQHLSSSLRCRVGHIEHGDGLKKGQNLVQRRQLHTEQNTHCQSE